MCYSARLFDTNYCSVPCKYRVKDTTVKAYSSKVESRIDGLLVAIHGRCLGRKQEFLGLRHYLSILEQKGSAIRYARPVLNFEKKNSLCEFTASTIKCSGIMCLASDVTSNIHCCICYLLNLLILRIIHLEPLVLIVLFTSTKMQLNHILRFFFIQLVPLMNHWNAP